MMEEVDRCFNNRRALEERVLAAQSSDSVAAIPHAALARLHQDQAAELAGPAPSEKVAIDVAAVDGEVVMVNAAGVATALTPQDALLTSDRLIARAREAGRQKPPS